jgi:hypothetical protein
VHEHVAYHSLHPMHCIFVSVSYLHICDRSHGARTRGAAGASTPVHLTIILEIVLFFFYLVYDYWMCIKL